MKFIRSFLKLFIMIIFSISLTSCLRGSDNKVESLNGDIRIISLAPSNTEILSALGMGDNIVAVDMYSSDVEGLNDNVEIFKTYDPSVEEILKLDPTHVILADYKQGPPKYSDLENAGVKLISIETPTSIQEIYNSIEMIGSEFSKGDEARNIIQTLKDEVKLISEDITNDKPRVYFEISQAPYLYSFGNGTYLNEMIEILGGENIFKDLNSWIAPSEESVVDLNPDIIFTNVDVEGNIEEIKNRDGWENVEAIKNGRVYYIDKNYSSRPSQFFINALQEMNEFMKEDINEN